MDSKKRNNFINWMMNKCSLPLTTTTEIFKYWYTWVNLEESGEFDFIVFTYCGILLDLSEWEWTREYEEVIKLG